MKRRDDRGGIDRPLGKDQVRCFVAQNAAESLIMGRIYHGAAIDLAGESGARLENGAGLLRFGGADGGATMQALRATKALAAIEIEQRHPVAEIGEAGDGSGATAFRVARMAAGDHNSKRARLRVQG